MNYLNNDLFDFHGIQYRFKQNISLETRQRILNILDTFKTQILEPEKNYLSMTRSIETDNPRANFPEEI